MFSDDHVTQVTGVVPHGTPTEGVLDSCKLGDCLLVSSTAVVRVWKFALRCAVTSSFGRLFVVFSYVTSKKFFDVSKLSFFKDFHAIVSFTYTMLDFVYAFDKILNY